MVGSKAETMSDQCHLTDFYFTKLKISILYYQLLPWNQRNAGLSCAIQPGFRHLTPQAAFIS